MALREYRDAEGTLWQVWDVHPTHAFATPRSGRDRRQRHADNVPAERRAPQDRRSLSTALGPEHGWLCFECAAEKRRLLYLPPDWDSCDTAQLGEYLTRATPVRRRLAELEAATVDSPTA